MPVYALGDRMRQIDATTFVHPDAETLEILPADTFATAKVNTKIIRITKPN